MVLQKNVFFNPPIAMSAGKEHNNCRNSSIYRSGVCPTANTLPGLGYVVTGLTDHTRLVVSPVTAALLAVAGNYLVLNRYQPSKALMPFNSGVTVLNAATTAPSEAVYLANRSLLLTDSGIDYVVVEKAINYKNPVYIRVSNPVGTLQGVGFFSDTASADHVLVPRASWYAGDTFAAEAANDPGMTQVQHVNRIRLSRGYSLAPLALRFAPRT